MWVIRNFVFITKIFQHSIYTFFFWYLILPPELALNLIIQEICILNKFLLQTCTEQHCLHFPFFFYMFLLKSYCLRWFHFHTRGSGTDWIILEPKVHIVWLMWTQLLVTALGWSHACMHAWTLPKQGAGFKSIVWLSNLNQITQGHGLLTYKLQASKIGSYCHLLYWSAPHHSWQLISNPKNYQFPFDNVPYRKGQRATCGRKIKSYIFSLRTKNI